MGVLLLALAKSIYYKKKLYNKISCKSTFRILYGALSLQLQFNGMQILYNIVIYYIDTDEIPGFFLLLKNHIFIARSKDTIFIFHV